MNRRNRSDRLLKHRLRFHLVQEVVAAIAKPSSHAHVNQPAAYKHSTDGPHARSRGGGGGAHSGPRTSRLDTLQNAYGIQYYGSLVVNIDSSLQTPFLVLCSGAVTVTMVVSLGFARQATGYMVLKRA